MTDAGDLSPCICHLQTPHPYREVSLKMMDDRLFCYKSVLLDRCFGFAVEEWIFGRCADGNSHHAGTISQIAKPLCRHAGRKHHTTIHSAVGRRCTGRSHGNTHIDGVDGTRYGIRLFGTGGIAAMAQFSPCTFWAVPIMITASAC